MNVRFLIQITDPGLNEDDQATEVQYLLEDLRNLPGLEGVPIRVLEQTKEESRQRIGVQFAAWGDQVRPVMGLLCDRMVNNPMEHLVLLHIQRATLQIKTHDAEELAALILAAEYLLPTHRTFLAKAEMYARTDGEISPAEEANLEWLRQQLDLPLEDAAQMVAKAMGPYRTRQEKQQRYRMVLEEEIRKAYPLSDATWTVLRELAINLKLPAADTEAINRERITQIQAQAEAARQQREAEAQQRREQEERRQKLQEDQMRGQEQQQYLTQYRSSVREAIRDTPHYSDYDRGRLEEARRIWKISPEDAKAIEAEVLSERYGPVQSAVGADYTRLRELLWSGQWEAADKETERVILRAISQDMQPIEPDQFLNLPCQDLQTLDQLWARYSDYRFGFSAQLRLYLQAERRPLDFLQSVGWQGGVIFGNLSLIKVAKAYHELIFSQDAPPGHLPTWRWGCPSINSGFSVSEGLIETVFLHVEKCIPINDVMMPTGDPLS